MAQMPPCRVVHDRFESPRLRGNPLGDPPERELTVILPPSYDDSPTTRFPLVLFLQGFGGAGYQTAQASPLGETLPDRIARLVAAGELPEVIVASPDCSSAFGGSQYVDSSAVGPYESYVIEDIVPRLDARYRTRAGREHRGVMGRSSGGIGALWLAMRHPDLFSAAASHAGDAYFELSYYPDFPRFVRLVRRWGGTRAYLDHLRRTTHRTNEDILLLGAICSAAAYSPNLAAPLGFDLPFDEETGELRDEVLARWRQFDPVHAAAAHADALRSLKLVYLDAGTRDEYFLDLGARILAGRLHDLGAAVVHEEFDDGHRNTPYRYDRSLPLLARALGA